MTPAQKRVIDEAKIFVWFYRGLRDLEALTDAVVAVQKEEDDAPTLGMPTEIEICGCDESLWLRAEMARLAKEEMENCFVR